MSVASELVGELEEYSASLQRLIAGVISAGKSATAIELLQNLTNLDIGKIGWKIPPDWRAGDTQTIQKLESIFNQLGLQAETLTELAKNESTPPTLSMLAYSISMTIKRMQPEPPKAVAPGTVAMQEGKPVLRREKAGFLTWSLLVVGGVLVFVSFIFGLMAILGSFLGSSKTQPGQMIADVACLLLPLFLVGLGLFGYGIRRWRRRGYVAEESAEKKKQGINVPVGRSKSTVESAEANFVPTTYNGMTCAVCEKKYDPLLGGRTNRIYYGNLVGRSQAGRTVTSSYNIAGSQEVFVCYNCVLKEKIQKTAIGPMFFLLFGFLIALISLGTFWFVYLPFFAIALYLFIDRQQSKKALAGDNEQASKKYLQKHEKDLAKLAPEVARKSVEASMKAHGYNTAITQDFYNQLKIK